MDPGEGLPGLEKNPQYEMNPVGIEPPQKHATRHYQREA